MLGEARASAAVGSRLKGSLYYDLQARPVHQMLLSRSPAKTVRARRVLVAANMCTVIL